MYWTCLLSARSSWRRPPMRSRLSGCVESARKPSAVSEPRSRADSRAMATSAAVCAHVPSWKGRQQSCNEEVGAMQGERLSACMVVLVGGPS